MIRSAPKTLEVPYKTPIVEFGALTIAWSKFFETIRDYIDPLGYEKSSQLDNNIATPTKLEGFSLDRRKVSCGFYDYLIQRVTTDTGATELIESGTFRMHYLPTSDDWVLSNGPTTAGITLTKNASGDVLYTSSNITGEPSISKITVRIRTLAAKNYYSEAGR